MASVTSPAGLVKLMTQASGASRATRWAMSTATGTVRPYAMPPAPTVSWPRTPSSECHPLVVGTSLQAADANRGEDEVGAAQGVVEVGGEGHLGGVRQVLRLLGQHPGDGL